MVQTPSLLRPFLDAAPPAIRGTLEAIADLDRRLWTIVAEGRNAWPDLTVDAVEVRRCLNDLRKGKREILVDDDHLIAQHAIAQDDPEVEYMKRTYSTEFKAAFSESLKALGPREQTLLRYHHVDNLNIDEIGA